MLGLRSSTILACLLTAVVAHVVVGTPVGDPESLSRDKRETRRAGRPYAEANGTHASAAALSLNGEGHEGDFVYGRVHSKGKTGFGAHVGVAELTAEGSFAKVEHSFLTAGIDAKFCGPTLGSECGLMGRARITDATVHFGPVNGNIGVGADTGAYFDGRNVEVMFFGIGGKAGADGFQACFIVCLGLSW